VVFALIGCLLVAISIGQLAKHLPSAGASTRTRRGDPPAVGFLVAWGYAFVEPLVAPALYLIFGQVIAGTLQPSSAGRSRSGGGRGDRCAVFVLYLGYYGIQVSTRSARSSASSRSRSSALWRSGSSWTPAVTTPCACSDEVRHRPGFEGISG
jgi:amino acid transporter